MWKSAVSGLFLALLLAGCGGNPSPVACQTATVTLNLNSGYDQYGSATLANGQMDNEWWITAHPDPSFTTPKMATVVNASTASIWGSSYATSYPNSRWIAPDANATAYVDPNTPVGQPLFYEYTYYFTLPNGASSPSLKLKANADNAIEEISLNGNTLYASVAPAPGGNFAYPPATASTSNASYFNYGSTLNKLVIKVRDTYRSQTGLIVEGQISYTDCCREPIQQRPEVQSLSFFERTAPNPGLSTITIPKNDNKLLTRLSTLSPNSSDFNGVSTENYDVFYSDWDGTPNPNGAFITIEAVYNQQAPAGGGLNIAEVRLNTSNGSIAADSITTFVGLGDNFIPTDVVKAIDGSLSTNTTMGNTVNQGNKRLRITLGFPCCKP